MQVAVADLERDQSVEAVGARTAQDEELDV
jgi:hypothetical protein